MKNKSYTHAAKLIRVGNTTVAIPKVNLCWNDIFEEVKNKNKTTFCRSASFLTKSGNPWLSYTAIFQLK